MAPGPVIEDFKVVEGIGPVPGFIDTFSDSLFSSELKKDLASALSRQLPGWLMLGARLLARQNRASRRCSTGCPGRHSKIQVIIWVLLICRF